MLKGKRVLLITASHLSSCPRLIKEAQLLSDNKCEIHVVYLNSLEILKKADDLICEQNPSWKFYPIYWRGNKANKLKVLSSQLYFRFAQLLNIKSDYIQSTSKILIDKVLEIKADLYIAHHPSVLVAAAKAAEKYNAKFAYDIEDAFAYIENDRFLENPDEIILHVERKYISNASFTSSASPLYNNLYTSNFQLNNEPIDVLNAFNINEDSIEYKDRIDMSKVSFYWYSQTVGLNRGLQDLFKAINHLPINTFELHIRGMCTEEVKQQLLNLVYTEGYRNYIYFHPTVSIEELEKRNKEHDIGFALEGNTSLNRDLCISNKILDYLRSGLMIVATNTKGHLFITEQFGEYAINYNPGDVESLTSQLQVLINNPNKIKIAKSKSLDLAKEKYNYRKQSIIWLNKVTEVLS